MLTSAARIYAEVVACSQSSRVLPIPRATVTMSSGMGNDIETRRSARFALLERVSAWRWSPMSDRRLVRDAWVSPQRVAIIVSAAIGFLGVAGVAGVVRPEPVLVFFDLDGELNPPALFSAALLLTASASLFRIRRRFTPAIVPILFSAFLVLAAVDEAAELHERLERWLGVDWQLLYLPAFVAAVILWSLLLAGIWNHGLSRTLFIASAAAWVGAQVLEFFQWDVERSFAVYNVMMVAEEMLEMTGTALMLLALLYADRPRQRDDHKRPEVTAPEGIPVSR